MEQDYKQLFELILDKDEEIIKTFKPDKVKMCWWYMWCAIWTNVCILFCGIPVALGIVLDPEIAAPAWAAWLTVGILAVVVLIIFLLYYWFFRLAYAKCVYAYSNKRVIIRHGVFGTDYKSLDMSMVGATGVNVGILDKMIRKNTGSIFMGSMASPVMAGAMFALMHVKNPYEVYKEIKEVIDNSKIK